MSIKPLQIDYDKTNDFVMIEGIRYAADFFRAWGVDGLPVGQLFMIETREPDGSLVIKKIEYESDLPEPLRRR